MSTEASPYCDNSAGFSLLETLFALVIMSMASMALFQSTSAMLSLSDRAVSAGERALDDALDRRALDGLLSALVPHWPEQAGTAFTGTGTRMSGVSSAGLSRGLGFTPFSLSVEAGPVFQNSGQRGEMLLQYQNTEKGLGSEDAPVWTLARDIRRGARFTYLGIDNRWYENWPPPVKPVTPYFNDANFIAPSVLPVAIKLESAQKQTLFLTAISDHSEAPIRFDLARDTVAIP